MGIYWKYVCKREFFVGDWWKYPPTDDITEYSSRATQHSKEEVVNDPSISQKKIGTTWIYNPSQPSERAMILEKGPMLKNETVFVIKKYNKFSLWLYCWRCRIHL